MTSFTGKPIIINRKGRLLDRINAKTLIKGIRPPPNKRIKIVNEEILIEIPSTSKENNKDCHENNISWEEKRKRAWRQGFMTDVSFTVGPQGTSFSAHKTILAISCSVFADMFYGSLKTTSETINIPDLLPRGFELLLDYLYTDGIEFKNETDALYACLSADKYCLPRMRDICCNYLSQRELTNENVWIILENSVLLNFPSLTERCQLYLKKNIDEAIASPGFLDVSGETLKKIRHILPQNMSGPSRGQDDEDDGKNVSKGTVAKSNVDSDDTSSS